ncbi:MAG TPA: hypothetical protein VHI50_03260 [Micromonosporaceae bacterium]|nr:hypothetical protein [Micromonosporaceae bacterium]
MTFPNGHPAAVAASDLGGDGELYSAEEVQAVIVAGAAVDTGVVKQFECAAITLPSN